MRSAFLTMRDPGNFVTDYDVAIPYFENLGWSVDCVPWRDSATQWRDYDAVYVCTPWDYPAHADEFLRVLQSIEAAGAVLVNNLALVRWNMQKTYLRDLAGKGAAIVPSSWHRGFKAQDLPGFFARHQANSLVLKPQVGANAADTYVLTQPVAGDLVAEISDLFRDRHFLVQPFIESIKTEGEYSLFFFSGEYSHCIRKIPRAGDFRVQEEHGAEILAARAPVGLVDSATKILRMVQPEPAYARADFVRALGAEKAEVGARRHGEYLLMELELIEPSLYLRTDADAPSRFAAAFDRFARSARSAQRCQR